MKSGIFFSPSIVIVNCPGHAWDRRPVLSTSSTDGFVCLELLEEQSIPSEKRMVSYLHDSFLTEIDSERQNQIAGTMGLRLEKLPY